MQRGEIWIADLEPTKGREQQGRRPVLVVTSADFNKLTPPLVCPIATAAVGQRMTGLTVNLQGAGTSTTGVVLCAQIRVLDIRARHGKRIETIPQHVLDEVLDCLRDILD